MPPKIKVKNYPPIDAAWVTKNPSIWISDALSVEGLIKTGKIKSNVWCTNDDNPPTETIQKYNIPIFRLPSITDMKFNSQKNVNFFFKTITTGRNAIEQFINEKKTPILVSCSAGVNRSASVIMAWLMTRPTNPLSWQQAHDLLDAANARRGWKVLTNSQFKNSLKLYPEWYSKFKTGKRPIISTADKKRLKLI